MIRLIVTDLDGTVVGKDERLPQEFIEAVARWRDAGIHYTFATGRVSGQVQAYVEALDLRLPYITCNGGALQQGKTVLWQHTIPLKPLSEIFRLADDMGMSLLYSINGQENAYRPTEYVQTQQREFGRYASPKMFSEMEWETLRLDKLIVMAKVRDGSLDAVEALCAQLPKEYYYKRYANKAIDILHRDATKERAVAALARYLEIPLSQVLAAGDDLNDIEMLCQAGIGVAVGNALDCVKEAADYVATGERHLGVMEAVGKFCASEKSGVSL